MKENSDTTKAAWKASKFSWIKDIIYINVLAKLKGKEYANILDIASLDEDLLNKLSDNFSQSRYYAFVNSDIKFKNLNIRIETNEEKLKTTQYDLVLSVFNFHQMNILEIENFINLISSISDENTNILLSDIATNGFFGELMLGLGKIFNPRIKSVIPTEKVIELLTNKNLTIVENDKFKINGIWSAWIITCKKET